MPKASSSEKAVQGLRLGSVCNQDVIAGETRFPKIGLRLHAGSIPVMRTKRTRTWTKKPPKKSAHRASTAVTQPRNRTPVLSPNRSTTTARHSVLAVTTAPRNVPGTSNPSRRPTSWLTSSHGRHGGVFIQIVEWAREGTHEQEVQEFLDKHEVVCTRAERANPILRDRRKKIEKQKRREKRQRDVAQSG